MKALTDVERIGVGLLGVLAALLMPGCVGTAVKQQSAGNTLGIEDYRKAVEEFVDIDNLRKILEVDVALSSVAVEGGAVTRRLFLRSGHGDEGNFLEVLLKLSACEEDNWEYRWIEGCGYETNIERLRESSQAFSVSRPYIHGRENGFRVACDDVKR